MRPLIFLKLLGILIAAGIVSPQASAATLTGKVTGPDGTPFRAAFVQARNSKTHASVIVLSRQSMEAIAWRTCRPAIIRSSRNPWVTGPTREAAIVLSAEPNAMFDWTSAKADGSLGRNSHHSRNRSCSPTVPGKDKFAHCGSSCHGFQQFINVRRDENGWREVLKDQMSTRIGGSVVYSQIKNEQDVNELAAYASRIFGERRPGPFRHRRRIFPHMWIG